MLNFWRPWKLGAAVVLALEASAVYPVPLQFVASQGSLSAKATFEVSGTDFLVTLTNISTGDVTVPSQVLTGLAFTLKDPTSGSDISLTPISAVIDSGSSLIFTGGKDSSCAPVGSLPCGTDINGEWAYKGGLAGAFHGANAGISSSGLGIFGPGDLFPGGTNQQGPDSPDGVQYGITSQGDNPATGNGGIQGKGLIKNQANFKLKLPDSYSGFNLSQSGALGHIGFQYGTSLSETFVKVPEPSTAALLGLGVAGLIFLRRRHG